MAGVGSMAGVLLMTFFPLVPADFLPLRCSECHRDFCKDHVTCAAHSCPLAFQKVTHGSCSVQGPRKASRQSVHEIQMGRELQSQAPHPGVLEQMARGGHTPPLSVSFRAPARGTLAHSHWGPCRKAHSLAVSPAPGLALHVAQRRAIVTGSLDVPARVTGWVTPAADGR